MTLVKNILRQYKEKKRKRYMYRAIEQIGRVPQTALKEPHLFSYNKTTNCF